MHILMHSGSWCLKCTESRVFPYIHAFVQKGFLLEEEEEEDKVEASPTCHFINIFPHVAVQASCHFISDKGQTGQCCPPTALDSAVSARCPFQLHPPAPRPVIHEEEKIPHTQSRSIYITIMQCIAVEEP